MTGTEILETLHRGGNEFDRGNPGVSSLCQLFWEIETKHNLSALEISGVYPWPLLRMNLYYALTQQMGLLDVAHPALKSNGGGADGRRRRSSVASLLALQGAALRDRIRGRKRYAILGNGRRIGGIEPYTEALLNEIHRQSILIEPQAEGSQYEDVWDYRELANAFRSAKKKRKKVKSPALKEVAGVVSADFEAALGAKVERLEPMMARAIMNFRLERDGFRNLFRRNRTETFFLLNAYSRASSIAAARDLGCDVVELQHGFISRYHLGYSWPGSPRLAYAPDELWCFGPAWCEGMDLPAGVKTRSIGAPYIERHIENGGEKNDRLVVFTSQGVLGKRLLDIAIDVAMRRPDLEIVFRLHPNEILASYEAEMSRRSGVPENFSISHRDPSIFELLARARFQVGSFSTTLIEGMAVGAIPIVLRMPGCEYMEDIVRAGDALFAENAEEVSRLLSDSAGREPDFRRYYAVPAEKLVL